MTVFCMEMRSTQNWDDVRYRAYTTRTDRAERFRAVPKIPFTDSGHGIVPSVREHSGRRLPNIWVLQEHVDPHLNIQQPRRLTYCELLQQHDELLDALKALLLNMANDGGQYRDCFKTAERAIAKSTGAA